MRNPKTDFSTEISVFGVSFFLFDWEICKRIWKTVLKNNSLARSCIISKKKDHCSWEQFCKSFFGFPYRTLKRKSMKSGFGFLNWNPPSGWISWRWNPFSDFAFDCKIRNLDFPIKCKFRDLTPVSNNCQAVARSLFWAKCPMDSMNNFNWQI